jgi:hypothetical protein
MEAMEWRHRTLDAQWMLETLAGEAPIEDVPHIDKLLIEFLVSRVRATLVCPVLKMTLVYMLCTEEKLNYGTNLDLHNDSSASSTTHYSARPFDARLGCPTWLGARNVRV